MTLTRVVESRDAAPANSGRRAFGKEITEEALRDAIALKNREAVRWPIFIILGS